MNQRTVDSSIRFAVLIGVASLSSLIFGSNDATADEPNVNLALVASARTSYVSGHETLNAVNNGYSPANSGDKSHGAYGNWPQRGTQWVEYQWNQPIITGKIDVYWFDDGGGVRLPKACRLKYWNGSDFVPVNNPTGLGLKGDCFNTTTFDETTTVRLRLEFDSAGEPSTGVLQWRVCDSGKSPNFAPSVTAGVDRTVVLPGKTYLTGTIKDDGKIRANPKIRWRKKSGPGDVVFENAEAATTATAFTAAGDYVLELTANDGELTAADGLHVTVVAPPPAKHLQPILPVKYRLDNPLWNDRIKKLIVNWIPHCYNKLSDPNVPEGGIENFTQAGNKLAGKPHTPDVGPVFTNAWVYNTVESMCLALMVDPQDDREIIDAQNAIRAKLADWIPKILSAQESDGYLHTVYTLHDLPRWTNKSDHEGYLAGDFIEAAIAHYLMTERQDARMYEAAKKLADCWCARFGPAPKKLWYDGHEELEQALARLAVLVDDVEGPGKGRKYIDLAKFLLDCRKGGEEYDQSHLPVTRQYEAVGHAVRAVYCYSGMAAVAMETGDADYHSALLSLWDNIVNRKYYVTGGVGSGETSEGFGKDYSLPNNAYCESCAGCGELFFQHKMNLIYRDAKYADLFEETLYNAILGSIDRDGENFTYTNALDSSGARYPWHVCPCCVGNVPRTLLMLPVWTYTTGDDALYVNLFIGGTVKVQNVAGTAVDVTQKTDYPWSGKVAIVLNPAEERKFAVRIRVPNRNVSNLYSSTPTCNEIGPITVNGEPANATIENGYASISRTWKAGDIVELSLSMKVQRVKASDKVAADIGRVALRYGPLIYNIESVDQNVDLVLGSEPELSTAWKPDLLGGMIVIQGTFTNGARLLAIPNYARDNRGGRSLIWIKDR